MEGSKVEESTCGRTEIPTRVSSRMEVKTVLVFGRKTKSQQKARHTRGSLSTGRGTVSVSRSTGTEMSIEDISVGISRTGMERWCGQKRNALTEERGWTEHKTASE